MPVDENDEFEEIRLRPFVGASASPPPTRSERIAASQAEAEDVSIRAFLITGGRTTGTVPLEFESMVSLTDRGRIADVRFEKGAILELCSNGPLSVAELAAKLHIPLGAARVIAADLVNDSLLDVHRSDTNLSNDVAMLKRLIHGVRAL